MAVADPIAYESRVRPRYAAVAILGGVLLFAAAAVQATGPQAKVSELTVQLLVTNRRGALEVVGTVINGLGLLGLAATLTFLFNAARARKPDMNQATWITAIAGGVLAAIGGVAYGVVITMKAHDFATHGVQTYPQANALLGGAALAVLQYAGLLGSLLLAVSFVLISLNAMRVGLLTKFMGYLGMFAGALVLFQITSVPVVQAFWLLALAYLLSGRWPTGVPPSWRSGRAEAWPSSQELREQRMKAAGAGKSKPSAPPTAETVGASSSGRTRSSTSKRKRKRRR